MSAGALMEFGVLGPVEVRADGQVADAGHPRQRAVLAVLLLDLGRVVPPETLIDRVWGDDPPASVRNALYGYISWLRSVLAGAADPHVTLVRRPGGYLLQADADQLDLHRFRRLAAEAAAAGDERAAGLLREALGLWRGTALTGVDSPWLSAMRDTLEAERFAAVLDLNDIRLRQGQHAALASELAGQAAARPEDERLAGQLMLALYRSGRQGEALRWFEQTRKHLSAELGADPGPGLQALHQQILRADPSLALPAAVPSARRDDSRDTPVPRQLPPAVACFTGRSAELDALTGLLDRSTGQAPAVVISAIGGSAGVGKTALAVQWAHQVADRFPGGQLYVNLRGYDPDRPVPAADALAGFLRALGVAGQDIPAEEEECAARYRSLLADRRMLLVLDNAGSVEQVRPLLPGSPSCAVVVTSRDALAGLVARHGATRLELHLLPVAEAISLLRGLIGQRVDDDPDAAATLAAQCCRLPLALRVAAELAAARPGVPLAELAGELANQQRRLDLLDAGGDPRTAVRAVFSWSYRHLDAGTARVFRLLGLHPGPDFDPHAVAALTGAGLSQARRMLDVLDRAHLTQPTGPVRSGMHDLLRVYARELAAQDGDGEQDAALTRLFDYYLHTAALAMDTLYPAARRRRPPIPDAAAPVPSLADLAATRAWLDTERAALVAITVHAAGHGWPGHATRLAATLDAYLRNGGHYPEALTVLGHALGAASRTGDRGAEATVLCEIGHVDWEQSRFRQASDHFGQALALFREAGDRAGESRALSGIGLAETQLGRYEQAARHQKEAVAISRDVGDRLGEANALGNLGWVRRLQGRYQEAADYYGQTLGLSREIGDRSIEAFTLCRLGVIDLKSGRYQHAAGCLQQGLVLFQEIGDVAGESQTLAKLGDVYIGLGRYEQAAGNFERALTMFREIGDPGLEADALNGIGDVLFQTGETDKARAYHAAALRLASEIRSPAKQAQAHSGLARTYQANGDPALARHHWREALTRYTAIGAPEAGEIRAQLATTGDDEGDDDTPSEEGAPRPVPARQ